MGPFSKADTPTSANGWIDAKCAAITPRAGPLDGEAMMSGAMSPVPDDHPLMVAWKAYQQTEDYANTKRWADTHTVGSLWAAFEQGWLAAGGRQPFADDPPDAAAGAAALRQPDLAAVRAEIASRAEVAATSPYILVDDVLAILDRAMKEPT